MNRYRVSLIFRKPRDTGNFSIEASFEQMARCFPRESRFVLRKVTSGYLSNGITQRLKGLIEARRYRGDVNHITGDVHYLVFAFSGKRTVLTVHDCGFMQHPNPVARRVLKWLWLNLPVRHCRYVTAVSEVTKRDIIRYTGCIPEKVLVIPTIISEIFKPVEKPFNAGCPQILHVGLAPNKNFEGHVEAISSIRCRLHVIGKLEPRHTRILERYRISYTSEFNLTEDEMARAYVESDLLLFASTLEGFGMPILEAQTVGRPVVTSDLAPMRDVAGAGAILVDPSNVKSIRAGISTVVDDRARRDVLVSNGFVNVKRFSGEAVARQYEALYDAVVGRRMGRPSGRNFWE